MATPTKSQETQTPTPSSATPQQAKSAPPTSGVIVMGKKKRKRNDIQEDSVRFKSWKLHLQNQ